LYKRERRAALRQTQDCDLQAGQGKLPVRRADC
jgi:hypothetical protein